MASTEKQQPQVSLIFFFIFRKFNQNWPVATSDKNLKMINVPDPFWSENITTNLFLHECDNCEGQVQTT